ncbi:hypothetical protein ACP70R_006447 [Stipagrostis hirtigluma subsp. patula]
MPRSPLLDEVATKVQKVFKGHRTWLSLVDCAIWWRSCSGSSTTRHGWTAAPSPSSLATRKRIAKVAKGLWKDDRAQQLALRHCLKVIGSRCRLQLDLC